MNKQRRNRIAEALELISQARDILEEVKDEEQESYENLPESLQYGEPAAEGSRLIAAICIPWKNSGGHTSQKVCGRSTGFQLLFNAKSSPHGKTKRQNRRAAHMERQRAPPKGREAENGSRGIDSRGRIPERLRRCNGRYAKEKRAEAAAGADKESPPLVFH